MIEIQIYKKLIVILEFLLFLPRQINSKTDFKIYELDLW